MDDWFTFQEIFAWFDKRMNEIKVLLIVDNCRAHPKVTEGLINIELIFLPPNTTLKVQPCDDGIIRALKIHYRRRFYSSILEAYEVGATNPFKNQHTKCHQFYQCELELQCEDNNNCKLQTVSSIAISDHIKIWLLNHKLVKMKVLMDYVKSFLIYAIEM